MTFTYSHSGSDAKDILAIRNKYIPHEMTKAEVLHKLDREAARPANVFAYVFGCVAAIIMGAGMSLVMTDIGAMLGLSDTMLPGVITGVIGMLLAIINYPIYKNILNSRRKKYSQKIITLSDEILNG